ncbi:MAG: hypothetical protein KTR24_00910 [Saprospiraceae bacterium]|nr:hypothetical protein [Saprospiraceae bacterium]
MIAKLGGRHANNVLAWVICMVFMGLIVSGRLRPQKIDQISAAQPHIEIEKTALFYTESPLALEAYYERVKESAYRP